MRRSVRSAWLGWLSGVLVAAGVTLAAWGCHATPERQRRPHRTCRDCLPTEHQRWFDEAMRDLD